MVNEDRKMVPEAKRETLVLSLQLGTDRGTVSREVILTASGCEEIDEKLDEWLRVTRQKGSCFVRGYRVLRQMGGQRKDVFKKDAA